MDYNKMNADDFLKFVEIRSRLERDVCWKLKKVYYSLPYPSSDSFDLTSDVARILHSVEELKKDIEEYVAAKVTPYKVEENGI